MSVAKEVINNARVMCLQLRFKAIKIKGFYGNSRGLPVP